MIATDIIILGMFVVTAAYAWSRGRGGHASHIDTVVMRSIPGLIISGTLFGALGLVMIGFGAQMAVLHPMELTNLRIGPVHDWAVGIATVGLGLGIAFVAYPLFGMAIRIRGERRAVVLAVAAARPAAAVVPVVRVADLATARRAALLRITPSATVDQLAATARDFLRDAYATPPADVQARWQPLLDRFDAARFGGTATDPASLAAELRTLVG